MTDTLSNPEMQVPLSQVGELNTCAQNMSNALVENYDQFVKNNPKKPFFTAWFVMSNPVHSLAHQKLVDEIWIDPHQDHYITGEGVELYAHVETWQDTPEAPNTIPDIFCYTTQPPAAETSLIAEA